MFLVIDGEKLFWKVFGRIPRPERSGVISICLHFILLYGVIGGLAVGIGDDSICAILPHPIDWLVPKCNCEITNRKVYEEIRKSHVMWMAPIEYGTGENALCRLQWKWSYPADIAPDHQTHEYFYNEPAFIERRYALTEWPASLDWVRDGPIRWIDFRTGEEHAEESRAWSRWDCPPVKKGKPALSR